MCVSMCSVTGRNAGAIATSGNASPSVLPTRQRPGLDERARGRRRERLRVRPQAEAVGEIHSPGASTRRTPVAATSIERLVITAPASRHAPCARRTASRRSFKAGDSAAARDAGRLRSRARHAIAAAATARPTLRLSRIDTSTLPPSAGPGLRSAGACIPVRGGSACGGFTARTAFDDPVKNPAGPRVLRGHPRLIDSEGRRPRRYDSGRGKIGLRFGLRGHEPRDAASEVADVDRGRGPERGKALSSITTCPARRARATSTGRRPEERVVR